MYGNQMVLAYTGQHTKGIHCYVRVEGLHSCGLVKQSKQKIIWLVTINPSITASELKIT